MDADPPDDADDPRESGDGLAWETTGTETAFTCPGFDVVRDDVVLPDGTATDFHYASEPPSVVVLPFTTEGEVVVIEEWRQAVDRVNRGLPAGGLEPDDVDPATAARRELREETGYVAGDLEHLTTVEPANGATDFLFHYYVARECRPDAEQDLDENESIRVRTTEFASLRDAAVAGDLRDGRTALGVLQYAVQSR